jgi:hypothetical protein
MFAFMLALAISFAVTTLIIVITKTVKHKFSASRPHNALTLKPYYMLIVYMFSNILLYSLSFQCRSGIFKKTGLLFANLAGSLAVALQGFEWFMYASMV